MPGPETPLQETQRHVHEGAMRIDRQGRLIEHLQRQGHERLLTQAKMLLVAMKDSQEQGLQHLSREEAKLAGEAEDQEPSSPT